MTGTVYRYIDVIWFDNLIMNYILLWTVRKLSKNTSHMARLWAAAFVGAIYAVMALIQDNDVYFMVWLKILISIAMILIAYKILNIKDFFKVFGLFYLTAFVFGGAALGLYYFFDSGFDIGKGVFYIKNYPVKLIFFSVLLIILFCRYLWPLLKTSLDAVKHFYKLELEFENARISVDALLDTGNELNDPISKKPVMIVEFDEIKDILPNDIKDIYQQSKEDNLEYITQVLGSSTWLRRFCLIPYKSLGSSGGMLTGYKPDKARILINGSWKDIRDIIVGIYNSKLSQDNDYHAIIHPQIIP